MRFVPLIGAEGWAPERQPARVRHAPRDQCASRRDKLGQDDRRRCEPFGSIDTVDLDPLLERIGDARVVLLGEATHGTSEFYRMRERISRELIEQEGLPLRRHRGRLAGRGARRSLRAASRISALRMDRVRPLSDLDVAQPRGARLRRLAARAQCGDASPRRGRVSRPRSLQPVHLDPLGAALSRRGRPGRCAGRAPALWLPDAVAGRPGDLRPGRADRHLPHLRSRTWCAC